MKRHKFTKWNKEKVSIYASAALVVCVCVVSGIYAGIQSPSKKQIIDIESVEDDGTTAEGIQEEEELTVTVTNDGNSTIPTGETADNTVADISTDASAAGAVDAIAADLTGDAEVAQEEIVEIDEEILSVPTMADSNSGVLHFNADEGLSWPVIGNIVMNYSMDERLYFATLNQYCYYPAVAISATVGDPVSSAAAGQVTKIGINEEIGQYAIVDLGDGYQATYGQLTDMTIEQGDKVSKGQIIGYVAEPTKYYTLEGTNIYFKLEQDGTSINPVGYFK